jgi:hypothetical protein
VAFILSLIVAAISDRTPVAARTVDRYITVLTEHARRRSADYAAGGDAQRAEAVKDLAKDLEGLLAIYLNSGVPAPTMIQAGSAPHGDPEFLIRTYKAKEADEGQGDEADSDEERSPFSGLPLSELDRAGLHRPNYDRASANLVIIGKTFQSLCAKGYSPEEAKEAMREMTMKLVSNPPGSKEWEEARQALERQCKEGKR